MSRRRMSIGIGAYAFDKVAIAVIQILMVPVLVNAWGLTLYGIWAIVMTVPSFLVLGDFGIVNSAAARMILFVARGEWDNARAALHTAWAVTLGIIALAMAGLGWVIWRLPPGTVETTAGFTDADSKITLMLLLVYGLVSIVFRLNTAAYRAAMHYTLSILCSTGVYVVENLAVVVLAMLGYGPVVAAAGLLAVRLLSVLAVYIVSMVRFPRLKPGFSGASEVEWRAMWRPALAASALGFGTAAYLQGSVMILGTIAGAAAVPAFIAVRTISRLGVQMATLVSTPVGQEFGNALAREESFRGGRLFGLIAAIAAIMAVGAGVGLVLLGGPVVTLWTHGKIHADAQLLAYMAISSVAAMLWNPLSNLILTINRQNSFSYANLAVSAVGLFLIWLLAGSLGAAAAGLSFALVDTVTFLAVALFIARHWLSDERFRAGIASTLAELRNPFAILRSLKGTAE